MAEKFIEEENNNFDKQDYDEIKNNEISLYIPSQEEIDNEKENQLSEIVKRVSSGTASVEDENILVNNFDSDCVEIYISWNTKESIKNLQKKENKIKLFFHYFSSMRPGDIKHGSPICGNRTGEFAIYIKYILELENEEDKKNFLLDAISLDGDINYVVKRILNNIDSFENIEYQKEIILAILKVGESFGDTKFFTKIKELFPDEVAESPSEVFISNKLLKRFNINFNTRMKIDNGLTWAIGKLREENRKQAINLRVFNGILYEIKNCYDEKTFDYVKKQFTEICAQRLSENPYEHLYVKF